MAGEALSYTAWAAGVFAVSYVLIRIFWNLRSAYKLRRAGPRPSLAARAKLWRDPGDIERLDLVAGPGGRAFLPAPP